MSVGPPTAAGRIDLHSHLLPGVDDGCRDAGESLACARGLIAMGYAGSVCTPHFWPAQYPRITLEEVARRVQRLRAALQDAGLAYRLWPGGELRLFEDADRWMAARGVPALGGAANARRTVLVDTWRGDWPAHQDRTLGWLLGHGYTPLLAHPERSPTRHGFGRLVKKLAKRGVLFQGNLRSFSGGEGEKALDLARGFLADGRYACLSSDTHRPPGLFDRAAGLEAAGELAGEEGLRRLTVDAPRELLGLPPGDL